MFLDRTVKDILETSIDSLLDNFAQHPYIHRCEHSIHCELYAMLTVHRAFQGLYPLKGPTAHSTTLIHKEWPETISRLDKKGRRGNFDLVILNPEDTVPARRPFLKTFKIVRFYDITFSELTKWMSKLINIETGNCI